MVYNFGYLNTNNTPTSSDGNPIKDRMLIQFTDNTYGPDGTGVSPIELAAQEASRLMDIFLKPYATVPFTTFPLDAILQMICADFAASVFKRRQYPTEQVMRPALQADMINDVEGTGWFAVGLKRLQDYIKSVYALGVTMATTVNNPETYAQLYKDGMITLKELRTFEANPTAAINRITNTTEIKNILTVLSNTELLTRRIYITKKQKSFAFISSDGNGGYQLDSEAY